MEVRKVSAESQLTLPPEFAGRLVSVEKIADGVLQVKVGQFVPEAEKLFHTEQYKERLNKFDRWMDKHRPTESDIVELARKKQT